MTTNVTVIKYLKNKGHTAVHKICDQLGISYITRIEDLTEEKRELIEKRKKEEGKKEARENMMRLITINAYRGMRMKQGLPTRGQRTRSNAKTAKKLNGRRWKG